MDLFLVLVLAIATILTTLLTEKIEDKRYKLWWRKITKKGWKLIGLQAIIFSMGIVSFIRGERKESAISHLNAVRDSTITSEVKKGITESREKLFEDLSIALAKQSLSLDTVRQVLTSVPNLNNGSSLFDPIIVVKDDGIKVKRLNDSLIYVSLDVTCYEAPIYSVDFSHAFEIGFADGTSGRSAVSGLNSNIVNFASNTKKTYTFYLQGHGDITEINVGIFGTYKTTRNGNKKYYRGLFSYDANTKITSELDKESARRYFAMFKI